MKVPFSLFLLAASTLLAGCVTDNKLVLDTVGPPPTQTTPTSSTTTDGNLLVYSAFRRNADFNSRDPRRQEYSDYEIDSADGKLLRRVHNNFGSISQDIVSVPLPAGEYIVKARANGYGFVTVPVMIEPHQNTVLHLEGGGFWPDESAFNQTNAVRLPDGLIVGWKARSKM